MAWLSTAKILPVITCDPPLGQEYDKNLSVINSPLHLVVFQTRFTAEKSMRLLLSTFSSLREELMQMSEDMRVRAVTVGAGARRGDSAQP